MKKISAYANALDTTVADLMGWEDKEIEKLNSNINVAETKIQNNTENAERYKSEIAELEEKIENLKQEIEQKQSKKDNLKQNKEKFEKELNEKEEELRKITEKLSSKELEIEQLKKERAELQAEMEDYRTNDNDKDDITDSRGVVGLGRYRRDQQRELQEKNLAMVSLPLFYQLRRS